MIYVRYTHKIQHLFLISCSLPERSPALDMSKYMPRYTRYLAAHIKYKSIKTQNAMNVPMIIPSLRFFADILPIKLFKPGT
jgi:hypothetical protein